MHLVHESKLTPIAAIILLGLLQRKVRTTTAKNKKDTTFVSLTIEPEVVFGSEAQPCVLNTVGLVFQSYVI